MSTIVPPIELHKSLIVKDVAAQKMKLDLNKKFASPQQSYLLVMSHSCGGCQAAFKQLFDKVQSEFFYFFIAVVDGSDETTRLVNDLEIITVPQLYKVENDTLFLEPVPLTEIKNE